MRVGLSEEDFALWEAEFDQPTRGRPSHWAKRVALVVVWLVVILIDVAVVVAGLTSLASLG